jgi:hypothetical protein
VGISQWTFGEDKNLLNCYSPDMALCDLFLFSKVKMLLMGKRFQDMEEIK